MAKSQDCSAKIKASGTINRLNCCVILYCIYYVYNL